MFVTRKRFILNIVFILSGLFVNHLYPAANKNESSSFDLSLKAAYLSRFTAYGIDLADKNPAWRISSAISHSSGFYGNAQLTRPVSSIYDAQQVTIVIGYEREFSYFLALSAQLSHFFYSSDTVNILSQFPNLISLMADMNLTVIDLGLSYDHYPGENGATYFSIDISKFFDMGHVYIMPFIQVVFISQTVEERHLVKGKSRKKGNISTVTTTGLSGLVNSSITIVTVYPVFKNISLSFTPSFLLSHQDELSEQTAQFIWNAGIRYKFKF